MVARAKCLVKWLKQSEDFYRSDSGRFDLFKADGYWVAIDGELGRVFRHADSVVAELWCEDQAEPQPGE